MALAQLPANGSEALLHQQPPENAGSIPAASIGLVERDLDRNSD
jgi:hypothetical protein